MEEIVIETGKAMYSFVEILRALQVQYPSVQFVGWIKGMHTVEINGQLYKTNSMSPSGKICLRPTYAKVWTPDEKSPRAKHEAYARYQTILRG